MSLHTSLGNVIPEFYVTAYDQPVRWRHADDVPTLLLISSPDDPEPRYSEQCDTEWTGDKVSVTETFDDETPNLITEVMPPLPWPRMLPCW